MVQAVRLFTSTHFFVQQAVDLFAYFFGELNRRTARSKTEERNLLGSMLATSETLCREATAAGENQRIPEANEPHLMHAQVYHSIAAAGM